jgi:hypothetical protein
MLSLWGSLLQYDVVTFQESRPLIGSWHVGESALSGKGIFGVNTHVPLTPIWTGFVVNTLCYATTLWLLFAFRFTLRRWNCTRRGLCGACAYPIGTSSICTECGAGVRSRADCVRVGTSEPQRAAHREE